MSELPVAEDRTRFIGGSDVAAILGQSPYKTRLQVYEEKIGEAESFEGNFHTRRGNRQERVAIEVFTERTGRKVFRVNERMIHPVYPFLTAKLDGRIVGERRVAEVKVPILGNFQRLKREGLGPEWIAQMQHYIGLDKGWEGGEWIIFNPDTDDLITFPMERDQALIDDMTDRLVYFWNEHVMKRIPPPAELADAERLEIKAIEGALPVFQVEEPEMIDAIRSLFDARQLKKTAEEIEDDTKARIISLTGELHGVYYAPGLKFSYTGVKGRASFDKKQLAAAKPLDRLTVGTILSPYLTNGALPEDVIKAIGQANLDLTKFDTIGQPYSMMKVVEVAERAK